MRTIPLRYLAEINPTTPAFDQLPTDREVGFLPLEAVWSDRRADSSRRALKADVSTGYTRYQPGDVLCPKVTPTFEAGRSMVAQTLGAGTTELHILRPRDGVDARWIAYAVRSKHFLDEGVTAFQGVAGLQRVPAEYVAGFNVIDVPAQEQRRISDFLDDRVARIDRIMAARKQQEDALAPFRRETVLSGIRRGPAVPLRRLLTAVRTGGTPPPEADSGSGLPWYTPGAFRDDLELGDPTRLVASAFAVHFPAETVLLVGIGATAGKVAWQRQSGTGNQQLTCLLHDRSVLDGRFLLHQLAARTAELRTVAPSATLPIINNEAVKTLSIRHASLREQKDLVLDWDRMLADHRQVAEGLARSCVLLSEYKQSLITAAVRGELDVTTAGSGIPG